MNTTSIARIVCLVFMLLAARTIARAQENRNADTAFAVSIVAGIGLSDRLVGEHGNDVSPWSPAAKLLWRPNRRLNMGVQAAWFDLQSTAEGPIDTQYGPTDFTAHLHATALLAVFEMEIWQMHLTGGIGASQVVSTMKAFEDESVGKEWMATYHIGAGHTWMFTRCFGLELGAGVYSITKLDETMGSLSLSLVFDVLRW